jgi:hypothetical protein
MGSCVLLFQFALNKPAMNLLPRVSLATKAQKVGAVTRKPSKKDKHGVFGSFISIPHRPGSLNLRFGVFH